MSKHYSRKEIKLYRWLTAMGLHEAALIKSFRYDTSVFIIGDHWCYFNVNQRGRTS